jgi:hypothetical protein
MTNHSLHPVFVSLLRDSVLIGLLAATTLMPASAFAAGLGAQIPVSATVIANAVAKIDHQTGHIQVEAADVARGYVDVSNATRFSVRTNSREGYSMEFYPLLDIFESVQVDDANVKTTIGRDGGSVVHHVVQRTESIQSLSYRFYLSASVAPGTYPFPLQMQVRALDSQSLFVSE